jgi:autotransporter-associated beta strand protein
MKRPFGKSWGRGAKNKGGQQPVCRFAARRGAFQAAGWERLERRMLLTSPGTIIWTGGSTITSNWSDPGNWNLGRAPINGDSLVFPASAQRLTNNDDIAGLAVSSITFQGTFTSATGGYALVGSNTLTVGSGGIMDNGSVSGKGSVSNQINLDLALGSAENWSNNDSNGLHELVVNGNVTNGGFALTVTGSGTIYVMGQISGSGNLAVTSAAGNTATLDLSGSNTYTGTTQITRATLVVDGSTAVASAVTVNPGATLGGTGTVGGPVTVLGSSPLPTAGATLDPGAGPDPSKDTGTLSNTGGVTFQLSSGVSQAGVTFVPTFAVQLGGTAANPTSDQLDSAGTVSIAAATLNLTALAGVGAFDAGQQFVIVQAGAPITGTFINLPEGSTVSDGFQNYTISYANDRVTLTAQPSFSYLNGQTGDTTAATFVNNLYRNLLGRQDDPQGEAYWAGVFQQIAGSSGTAAAQQTVANGFLGSVEYQQHLVTRIYIDFLHRIPDVSGLGYWLNALAAGVNEKTVLADIVGSGEYFDDAQGPLMLGTTPELEAQNWVSALYQDLLGRVADAGGLAYWAQQALSTQNLPAVAFSLLGTSEADQKVLNADYPAAGSAGAPGTPALGAYGLADIAGNGWGNLYFQGNLSASVVDSLFSGLQAGTSYNATIARMLTMAQYLDG